MQLDKQNVMIFTRSMGLGGTENVILQICEILLNNVNKIIVCSSGGTNVKLLDTMGIKHYVIPDITKKDIFTILKVRKTLYEICDKENITVIHTHHRMAAFYIFLTGLYKKCIFINTSHNTFTDKKVLTKLAYKHANIIACGEKVKENLINYYKLSDDKIMVIHNAVKPFFDYCEDLHLKQLREKGYFLVANVGRLSEQKGMKYFINAIPSIVKKHKKIYFLIVGSGEDEVYLKELAKNLNLLNYIEFLGYRSDIQNILSQVDLLVLSSLWEGLPLTPLEAFSVGKTVIATAVDGTVEEVKNGYNGLLINPKSSEEISNSIIYLFENKKVLKKLEVNAKNTYEAEYSIDKFTMSILKYYISL